jgi:hypothetical protein
MMRLPGIVCMWLRIQSTWICYVAIPASARLYRAVEKSGAGDDHVNEVGMERGALALITHLDISWPGN